MSEIHNDSPEFENIPGPLIKRARAISLVWLVPLIAAVIAIGLAVKTVVGKGPAITINFASAEGLEAGKTRIKYKDVEVGRVDAIQLDDKLSHVKVSASMVPEIGPYLTTATRFWVVRARVGAGEVSGLGTLLSGAYIAMDPSRKGSGTHHFVGLEAPPVVTMDTAGRYFKLRAERLGSLDIGAPVYFRQIKVGQVVHYDMQPGGNAVAINIFIRSPYDQWVNQNTRFWNASGMNVTVDSSGVRINTESILTLLEGGIAFATPENLEPGGPVDPEHRLFTLYASFDQINEPASRRKFYFLAFFNGTVRGLAKGASVEFRGIKIGEVVDLKLQFNAADTTFRIPVLCAVEPDRIEVKGEEVNPNPDRKAEMDIMGKLVRKGLRAQLRSGVLLTGQLFVNLDIHPEAPPAEMTYAGEYPVLPTVPGPVQEITARLTQLLERLEKLPIEQIGSDLGATVHHARQLMESRDLAQAVVKLNQSLNQLERFMGSLNTQLTPQVAEVLEQSRKAVASGEQALSAAQKVFSADAPLTYDLSQTLKELSKAARAISNLADLLERNPQALIYGKGHSQ
jgi:paraquat-inducible protein B